MIVINIATDFSKRPAGRDLVDSQYSATLFRDSLLIPMLKQALLEKEVVYIELDGVRGYSSCFLQEAFGRLNTFGYDKKTIEQTIRFKSYNAVLIQRIVNYLT